MPARPSHTTRAARVPEWLSLQEAAGVYRISVDTVRRRIAAGELPAARCGRRLIRVEWKTSTACSARSLWAGGPSRAGRPGRPEARSRPAGRTTSVVLRCARAWVLKPGGVVSRLRIS